MDVKISDKFLKDLPFPVIYFDQQGAVNLINRIGKESFKIETGGEISIYDLFHFGDNLIEFRNCLENLETTCQFFNVSAINDFEYDLTLQVKKELDGTFTGAVLCIPKNNFTDLETLIFQKDDLITEVESLAKFGSWEADMLTNYSYWSPGMYKIFELDEEKHMYHKEFYNYVLPEDIPMVEEVIRKVKETHLAMDYQYRIISAKGNLKYLTGRCKPVFRNNEVGKLIGYSQDVTDKVKNEKLLKGVIESMFCGLVIMKGVREKKEIVDFEFEYLNEYTEHFLQKNFQELKGKRLCEVFPGIKTDGLFELLKSVVETGVYQGKEIFYHHEHLANWVKFFASKYEDSCVVCFEDITESKDILKKYETFLIGNPELNKVNKLEKLNKELNTFVYAVSHDLRSPINNLSSLLSLFIQESQKCKLSESAEEYLKFMDKSINALKSTIHDLTEVPKIADHNNPELISIDDILENVKSTLVKEIKESNVEIKENLRENTIKVRPKNLHSIFFNIISNSIKYRNPAFHAVISIETKKAEDGVSIKISDNGLGMNEHDLEKLFVPFTRIHKIGEGTGLGMSIVKKIVELNGGDINVKSTPGKGTAFEIFLKNEQES